MAEIKAFDALRYTEKAGKLDELVCPPYDIISEEERKAFLARNPRNVIRLELPREGENPYIEAGDTLREWLAEEYLACDDKPGLYIYEEEFTAHGQRMTIKGLICRARLEPFEKGVVLPHEETLSKAKTDRLNLMKATGCNFSSIYSLYFDEKKDIFPRLEALSQGEPDKTFSLGDDIIHRLWAVYDEAEIAAVEAAFGDKKLYIADGHHRYETALNYKNWLKEQGELALTSDSHPANYCMMTLVNMENPGLVVFPTHRIVRGLDNFDPEALLAGCGKYFRVEDAAPDALESKLAEYTAKGQKAFALYYKGGAKLLVFTDGEIMKELLPGTSEAYQGLDVNILHTLILERLLGIDKENMANQKNLIYTRDPAEAMAAVNSGEADCAFLIEATRVEEIAAVAGAGEKMPQKSTYFYPKIVTGHIMNKIL
ncbi:MAG: DUF1015 domain-containing protein [Oscillospiraceae bacterium]